MTRGHVLVQIHHTSGNVMGGAHTNSILNTMMYQVVFTGVEVAECTTNVIVESMYTQCDADKNEYLLLDALFDYY